jgi:hypothetical protein
MTESINRDKYLDNLATVTELEYLKHYGAYSFQVKLQRNKARDFYELECMLVNINSLPDKTCISVGQLPSYGFLLVASFSTGSLLLKS